MDKVIDYILGYLLEDDNLKPLVAYTSDKTQWDNYKIVIVPSGFFCDNTYATLQSLPTLPLKKIGETPILFGDARVEIYGETKVVYSDFVASAYFLLSRYEEWLHLKYNTANVFDSHGRMIGTESVAYKAGIIDCPIVQEWGRVLKTMLGVTPHEQNTIKDIFLTHDVDNIAHYRTLRGFCGGMYRSVLRKTDEKISDVMSSLFSLHNDSAYTYPYLFEQDAKIPRAQKIYFVKAGDGRGFDYPQYNLFGYDFRTLFESIKKQENTTIGLHTSYKACENFDLPNLECRELENAVFRKVCYNRYHYLRTTSVVDFHALIAAGLTDDFTMGFADVAGFRLGTCKPVRWIDPSDITLTNLILHPLTVMDATLDRENYMNLNEQEAYEVVREIIDKTAMYAGELVLLWHNTSFSKGTYHQSLYTKIIDYLCKEF